MVEALALVVCLLLVVCLAPYALAVVLVVAIGITALTLWAWSD